MISFSSQIDLRITKFFMETAEEDQKFDRKRAGISVNDLATHIIGFANADGGLIVVGQTNDKVFQGII
jgi:hypothetical protein